MPGTDDPGRRDARPLWPVAAAIGLLSFLVSVWVPGPISQTMDEYIWTIRSDAFRTAIVDGNLANASNSAIPRESQTQPGVTTMWSGTLGYGAVKAGEAVGLLPEEPGTTHADRVRILRAGRTFVSLWCAIALAALVVVAAKLIGRRAAVVAGVLLAVEPFLVGHNHLLHTDAMVTLFGALAVLALAAAGRDRAGPVDRRLLVLAGVAAALTALTKLNGIPLVLGGAGVVLLLRTDWRRAGRVASVRRSALLGLAFLAVAVVAFFVIWPALWINPVFEIKRLPSSLKQLGRNNTSFFRNEVTEDPGALYYLFALPIRLSPWLLVAGAASVVAAVARLVRSARSRGADGGSHNGPHGGSHNGPHGGSDAGRADRSGDRSGDRSTGWPAPWVLAVLLLATLPYLVLISRTGQKYDRYALPVVPYLALLTGIGVVLAADRWSRRFGDRLLVPAGLVVTAAMAVVALAAQPYTIAYANPLLGGQRTARDVILLGWGEGHEVLGAEVARREAGRCDEVKIHADHQFVDHIAVACGEVTRDPVGPGDYVIRYISGIQLGRKDPVERDVMRRGELVETFAIDGVTYAELWQFPR